MSSEFNSLEDLAFSRSFRNWVLNKDAAEADFWENWLKRNSDKAELVRSAKALVYAMQRNTTSLAEEDIGKEVRKAVTRLREAPRYIPLDGLEGGSRSWMGMVATQKLWAAAALTAALALAGYFFYRLHGSRDALRAFLDTHGKEAVALQAAGDGSDYTFDLPDESLVRLWKKGKLYFPKDRAFLSGREVYLAGNAFFDIRKNARFPFFVYTGQIIVKALGTRFTIHALPFDNRTTVTVAAGKVVVYRREDFFASSVSGLQRAGLMLTPNQEGVYDRKEDRWQRTLVGAPAQMLERPDTSLVFRDTPVRQVLDRLHELYGVNFQYDEETAGSRLTILLGNEPFFDHLHRICDAIGGRYEVIDGTVVVMPGQGRSVGGSEQGRSAGGSDR